MFLSYWEISRALRNTIIIYALNICLQRITEEFFIGVYYRLKNRQAFDVRCKYTHMYVQKVPLIFLQRF